MLRHPTCSLDTSLEEEVNQVEVLTGVVVPIPITLHAKSNDSQRRIGMGILAGRIPSSVIGSQGLMPSEKSVDPVQFQTNWNDLIGS